MDLSHYGHNCKNFMQFLKNMSNYLWTHGLMDTSDYGYNRKNFNQFLTNMFNYLWTYRLMDILFNGQIV
jgi:hypothetical protein